MRDETNEDCSPASIGEIGSETPAEELEPNGRRVRDAALRLCVTMTMLPRAPHKISARSLAQRLADAGWGVTVRTVERDLHRLRSVFPIGLDDDHKPFGWSWLRDPRDLAGDESE